jgi:hypothetical protein
VGVALHPADAAVVIGWHEQGAAVQVAGDT